MIEERITRIGAVSTARLAVTGSRRKAGVKLA
jgi:hypothetical protein